MPGVSTSSPVTRMALPSVILTALAKSRVWPSSRTIWRFLKQVPSLSSMKPNALLSRTVRTQPDTVHSLMPASGGARYRSRMFRSDMKRKPPL